MTPTEVVFKLLANTTDLSVVRELVAEDATYVSLNYHNPDLTAVNVHLLPVINLTLILRTDRAMVRHPRQHRPIRNLRDIREDQ